eukprot:UN15515
MYLPMRASTLQTTMPFSTSRHEPMPTTINRRIQLNRLLIYLVIWAAFLLNLLPQTWKS